VNDTFLTRLGNLLSSRPAKCLEGPDTSPAAVLLLIFPKEGDYYIHVQKRSHNLEHHAGEACFPGGTPKTEDKSLLHTALREPPRPRTKACCIRPFEKPMKRRAYVRKT
jgi:hypothetical protein